MEHAEEQYARLTDKGLAMNFYQFGNGLMEIEEPNGNTHSFTEYEKLKAFVDSYIP